MSKSIKSICVVTEGYPYKDDYQFSFVSQLCEEFSRQNITVYVISPQSFLHVLLGKEKRHPRYREEFHGGSPIYVYRPYFLLLPYRFMKFNDGSFKHAVSRQFRKIKEKIDVCYGHFWNNAYYISEEAKKNNIPLFVASGEGNFDILEKIYTSDKYQKFSKDVQGVICVSSYCKEFSIKYNLTSPDKCIILPNSIDHKLFHIKDKKELRRIYGIDENSFIVAFVGAFIDRKGSNRLSQAISILNEEGLDIKSFFIGSGQGPENLRPTCSGVLYCGGLEHSKLPDYLNMADVFVLPTLNEGCSNAIIEAMACGLPIISSDKPFNHDILNESNSILINPLDIDETAHAISKLYHNFELRQRLSQGALKTSASLSLRERAKKIIHFIESNTNRK